MGEQIFDNRNSQTKNKKNNIGKTPEDLNCLRNGFLNVSLSRLNPSSELMQNKSNYEKFLTSIPSKVFQRNPSSLLIQIKFCPF